jgi:NAD(P)H-dependent FMN reductase
MEKKKIGIIVGSTREDRKSLEIAEWVKLKAGFHAEWFTNNMGRNCADLEYVLLDLKDYKLPFFGETDAHDAIPKWESIIDSCSAFIVVSPEYNHSVPGVLKNALDFAYVSWKNKPVGLVCFGFGSSGARAGEHLRQIFGALGAVDVQSHLLISLYDDMQNKRLSFRDQHDAPLGEMLKEIIYWIDVQDQIKLPYMKG